MDGEQQRAVLDALIRERGEDYAALSRLIGRNPAYIQQFIKRGSPRRLAEDDRRDLARYFRIPESALGGMPEARTRIAEVGDAPGRTTAEVLRVPRLAIDASAGPGALVGEEAGDGARMFDAGWLREIAGGSPAALSVIRVAGDSMAPTLADGDEILVDAAAAAATLREGVYVIRLDDVLMVKRLRPADGRIDVVSDNPAHPTWPGVAAESVTVVGRVCWTGRRIG